MPLTPAESAHLANLQALLASLRTAEADQRNPPAARNALVEQIDTVADQIDDLEAGDYSRTTVDLQAAAAALVPALQQLQALQAQLGKIGSKIHTADTIVNAVSAAITSCESLLS